MIAQPVLCWTCGRHPVDTYRDGSPWYDHGHLVDGTTWETTPVVAGSQSVIALLESRQTLTARDGRDLERWTFAAWISLGRLRHAVMATGITGTGSARRYRWHVAISKSGWCRVELDGASILARLSGEKDTAKVLDVRRVSRLSADGLTRYLEAADLDVADHDLVGAAHEVFGDMLEVAP